MVISKYTSKENIFKIVTCLRQHISKYMPIYKKGFTATFWFDLYFEKRTKCAKLEFVLFDRKESYISSKYNIVTNIYNGRRRCLYAGSLDIVT